MDKIELWCGPEKKRDIHKEQGPTRDLDEQEIKKNNRVSFHNADQERSQGFGWCMNVTGQKKQGLVPGGSGRVYPPNMAYLPQ